jgi:rRNA-processing protein FCF1
MTQFKVLIDTSVWLDLAENQRQTPLIEVLQHLVDEGQIKLLVPQIVMAEFKANRDRVTARSVKSLSTHFNLVKEAVRNAPNDTQKEKVLMYLSDLDHCIPIVGAAAKGELVPQKRTPRSLLILTSWRTHESRIGSEVHG